MQYKVNSEDGPLRFVITHSPGIEHDYVTPENLNENNDNYLLFDDLIQTDKARDEHRQLYNILHHFTDGNCFEFIDLLKVVISDKKTKEKLITDCIKLEDDLYDSKIDQNILISLTPDDLIKYKIGISNEYEYVNRIIFPSFCEDMKLNYFLSRTYDETQKRK